MARRKSFLSRLSIPEEYRPYIINKYVFTLTGFLVWLTFFDKHDFILQHSYRKTLESLEKEKEYYSREIDKNTKEMTELFTNQKNLEKFARERYYMKRDNEDVFVFVEKKGSE